LKRDAEEGDAAVCGEPFAILLNRAPLTHSHLWSRQYPQLKLFSQSKTTSSNPSLVVRMMDDRAAGQLFGLTARDCWHPGCLPDKKTTSDMEF
jgi:hypothetical protein